MYEAILSLSGAVIGGIIALFATVYVEKKNDAREHERNRKATLSAIISDYEGLLHAIRHETFFEEHGKVYNYYYNVFAVKRGANRANEVFYLEKSKREEIDDLEGDIWLLVEEGKLRKIIEKLNSAIEKMK